MSDDREMFKVQCHQNAKTMAADPMMRKLSIDWAVYAAKYNYTYGFTWLGLPIIQLPADIMALQEIIWDTKPDVIIETGIARGGSLIFYASLLHLLDNNGIVIGVDIDIRTHNRESIERHPFASAIHLIQGSSVDMATVDQVKQVAAGRHKTMIVLDSNHTHEHVYQELQHYSHMVSVGSYLIVQDTTVEYVPEGFCRNKGWDKGNNPKTAVNVFLKENDNFIIDNAIDDKLMISSAWGGYLKRIK
jgi:cephalosporin hydroxylase